MGCVDRKRYQDTLAKESFLLAGAFIPCITTVQKDILLIRAVVLSTRIVTSHVLIYVAAKITP